MQKIYCLSFVLLILVGCKTVSHIEGYDLLLGLDYRPYAEKGFLITPHTYTAGEYTTICLIDYKIMPDAEYKIEEGKRRHPGDGSYATSKKWFTSTIEPQEALDSIFDICVDMGADALIDFSILDAIDEHLNISNPVTLTGIRITGLAIRREE